MNLKLAHHVLKLLRSRTASESNPASRLALKVAIRWLSAGMVEEYDIMFRLQVLEGVAHVTDGEWWKKGRRGLSLAAPVFADKPDMKPEWLASSYSGMYGILVNRAKKAIVSYSVGHLDAEELVQNTLMGFGIDLAAQSKKSAYMTGEQASNAITTGVMDPKGIASGPLGKWVEHLAVKESKHFKEQQMPVDESGNQMQVGPEEQDVDTGTAIVRVIFHHMNNPISVKIRKLMRNTWHDSPQMLKWLDIVENEGYFPQKKEIGMMFGNDPNGASFIARHWKPRWRKFFQTLWSTPGLVEAIQSQLRLQGIEWDAEKPSDDAMDRLLSPRGDHPKTASTDILLQLFGHIQ